MYKTVPPKHFALGTVINWDMDSTGCLKHFKMALTDMAALLLAPKQLCSISFFFCVISYTISPERFLSYNILPEITFGYQSGGNSPALRPGIRLFRIGSFVRTPQGYLTYFRGFSKTPLAEKR